MLLIIFVTILIFVISYVLIVPVVIIFSLDSSLSRNLRIKIFPFDLRINKSRNTGKWEKIDFVLLLSNEYIAVKQVIYFCFRFAKALIVSKHHYITISFQGGFGSPDITGIVLGAIETVKPALGKNATIVYYPDMTAQSININLNAQSKVRIYILLAETLPLIFSLPLLKIARIFIKIKKGEYNARAT
jgi:hypothetical protein